MSSGIGGAVLGNVIKEFAAAGEDVQITDFYHEKLRVLEWINFYFGVIGSGSGIVACEIEFNMWTGYGDAEIDFLNYISLMSSLIMALSIFLRYVCILWWMRAKHFASAEDNLKTTMLWKACLFEVLLNGIAPMPYLNKVKFETPASDPNVSVTNHVNTLLSYISMVRIYLLIRALLAMTLYRTTRAQRICQMNACHASYNFSIKCLMNQQPLTIMNYAFLMVLIMGGYGLMIWERPLQEDIFGSYINCIWNAVITMTTVGYGDFNAQTIFGRITAVIICLWGVLLVSIMVVSLTNLTELNTQEQKAYILLNRLALKGQMKHYAIEAINSLVKRKILWKKDPGNEKAIHNATRCYNESIRAFSFANRQVKAMAPARTEVDNLARDVDDLREGVSELRGKVDQLLERKIEWPDHP